MREGEREEKGAGKRGPCSGQAGAGRPPDSAEKLQQKLGAERWPPYAAEEDFTEEQTLKHYGRYLRRWAVHGLSKVCGACRTLTLGMHCRATEGRLACRNCRERRCASALPSVRPVPAALAALNSLERRLLTMAKMDQVLIDKLPSGGPSAQWGRMYVVPTEEPEICDLLEEAELGEDGAVYVRGVASTARLERLHLGLQTLKEHHSLYKERPRAPSQNLPLSS